MTIKTTVCCFVIIVFALELNAQVTQQATPESRRESAVSSLSKVTTGIDLVEGKVVKVENGDTISVQGKGQSIFRVKLQAIDAPDVGQAHYQDSQNSLAKLIRGKDVRVVVHAIGPTGVMIGTVYRNGRDIGLSLLERGLAWHYKRFPYQQTAVSRKTYADAQNIASAAGLGLWADASPIPPWIFRGEAVSPVSGPDAGPASETVKAQPNIRKYTLGPRGGCYYVSESGSKVYVQDKSLCGVSAPQAKP